MDDEFTRVTQAVKARWGNVTLSDFHADALLEENGIMYESLKGDDRRFFLIVCVIDPDMIDLIERKIDLVEDNPRCDWSTTTVIEFLFHTLRDGLSYQDLRSESGSRTALLFCAMAQDKIRLLEQIFELPHA